MAERAPLDVPAAATLDSELAGSGRSITTLARWPQADSATDSVVTTAARLDPDPDPEPNRFLLFAAAVILVTVEWLLLSYVVELQSAPPWLSGVPVLVLVALKVVFTIVALQIPAVYYARPRLAFVRRHYVVATMCVLCAAVAVMHTEAAVLAVASGGRLRFFSALQLVKQLTVFALLNNWLSLRPDKVGLVGDGAQRFTISPTWTNTNTVDGVCGRHTYALLPYFQSLPPAVCLRSSASCPW